MRVKTYVVVIVFLAEPPAVKVTIFPNQRKLLTVKQQSTGMNDSRQLSEACPNPTFWKVAYKARLPPSP